ncbi:probable enoyl-CoA hydratase 2, mitochondrial isoform X1 [Morus notabilis]|uniref:probable enoyl-CoA hydratase 2, mitochondrial isoform X1 n=1 Tax=Morus notabilis TaxID=981085 RepID=UPI000CED59EB|nr:probable enoyl-CoA hydratase 2, mitochondrial isoform X1 [Morus notabilis]XP_024026876.1 probable enoyl-CoA hydratase 2, mitochondrial isoform X1 [Morus notabilis]
MHASRILRRSICHYIVGKHNSLQSFSAIQENYSLTLNPQKCLHQSCRTLILEPTSSQFVKLNRLSDLDSGIVEVSLDRPETKNAIGKDLLRGFKNALEEISTDSSAHVMLIRSSVPKVFCAGADLKERKRQSASEVQSFVNSLRSTFSFLEALGIPTIAVIEGAALGGGLEMALSCDLRICGEEAVLGLPETGLAIIPGAGGTQRLPRLVGKAKAKELIFTGRRISGMAALSIGLVNYCVPAGEAHQKALEIAREINEKGPIAIRMAKRAINDGLEVNTVSGMAVEQDCYGQLLDTTDRLEGLAAFAEKRKPKYTGE